MDTEQKVKTSLKFVLLSKGETKMILYGICFGTDGDLNFFVECLAAMYAEKGFSWTRIGFLSFIIPFLVYKPGELYYTY